MPLIENNATSNGWYLLSLKGGQNIRRSIKESIVEGVSDVSINAVFVALPSDLNKNSDVAVSDISLARFNEIQNQSPTDYYQNQGPVTGVTPDPISRFSMGDWARIGGPNGNPLDLTLDGSHVILSTGAWVYLSNGGNWPPLSVVILNRNNTNQTYQFIFPSSPPAGKLITSTYDTPLWDGYVMSLQLDRVGSNLFTDSGAGNDVDFVLSQFKDNCVWFSEVPQFPLYLRSLVNITVEPNVEKTLLTCMIHLKPTTADDQWTCIVPGTWDFDFSSQFSSANFPTISSTSTVIKTQDIDILTSFVNLTVDNGYVQVNN